MRHSLPRRHIDIRLLPSLVPEAYRNETTRIVEPELSARITKLRNLINAGIVDQESSKNGSHSICPQFMLTILRVDSFLLLPPDEVIKSTCPFTLYAQIDPVEVSEELMEELEDEIQKPTGIWTIDIPKLSIGGVLISKECGVLYEVTNTEGLRSVLINIAVVHVGLRIDPFQVKDVFPQSYNL
jgi:hypothetical protein